MKIHAKICVFGALGAAISLGGCFGDAPGIGDSEDDGSTSRTSSSGPTTTTSTATAPTDATSSGTMGTTTPATGTATSTTNGSDTVMTATEDEPTGSTTDDPTTGTGDPPELVPPSIRFDADGEIIVYAALPGPAGILVAGEADGDSILGVLSAGTQSGRKLATVEDDRLLALARDGAPSEFVAVGYHDGEANRELLFVGGSDAALQNVEGQRLGASGFDVEGHAVIPFAGDHLLAGSAGADRFFVGSKGAPSLIFEPQLYSIENASEIVIAQLFEAGFGAVGVGSFERAGIRVGFALGLDDAGSAIWSRALEDSEDTELIAGFERGSELVLVGRLGTSGLELTLDSTGMMTSTRTFPGGALRAATPGPWYVQRATADSGPTPTKVLFLGEDPSAGVEFASFQVEPSRPLPLVVAPFGISVVGSSLGSPIVANLGDALMATCGGEPFGLPVPVAPEAAAALFVPLDIGSDTPMTLAFLNSMTSPTFDELFDLTPSDDCSR